MSVKDLCEAVGVENILTAAQKEEREKSKPKFVYKDEQSAIEVLGAAIRKFMKETDTGPFKTKWSTQEIARIVSEAFLNDIILEEDNLINQSRLELSRVRSECERLDAQIKAKQKRYDELQQLIAEYEGREVYRESDLALAGAINAYYFILDETCDKDKAAKAFNSYLIGGKAEKSEYSEVIQGGQIVQKLVTGDRVKPERAPKSGRKLKSQFSDYDF